jgi:hypothetical protein
LMNFRAGRARRKSAFAGTVSFTRSRAEAGRSEHVEQREFVSWFRQTYLGVRIFAIPNGEARSKTSGARLKLEGVSPGVPDLFVPAWCLWIEMKRAKGGTVSAVQKDWHAYLDAIGHRVIVAHGFEDARGKVTASQRQPEHARPGL